MPIKFDYLLSPFSNSENLIFPSPIWMMIVDRRQSWTLTTWYSWIYATPFFWHVIWYLMWAPKKFIDVMSTCAAFIHAFSTTYPQLRIMFPRNFFERRDSTSETHCKSQFSCDVIKPDGSLNSLSKTHYGLEKSFWNRYKAF